jgi:biopolymer transport protein ExbD
MAGGMDLGTGGKGGKKPLDAAINLVPFIDLMAVTISFLIMTAVWTQIGRLQVASAGQGGDPTEQKDDKSIPLTLMVTEKELRLTAGSEQVDVIPRDASGNIDYKRLKDDFKKITDQLKDQNQITVQTEDGVKYDDLVHVIDEAVGDGLPNVSVSPVT